MCYLHKDSGCLGTGGNIGCHTIETCTVMFLLSNHWQIGWHGGVVVSTVVAQ